MYTTPPWKADTRVAVIARNRLPPTLTSPTRLSLAVRRPVTDGSAMATRLIAIRDPTPPATRPAAMAAVEPMSAERPSSRRATRDAGRLFAVTAIP